MSPGLRVVLAGCLLAAVGCATTVGSVQKRFREPGEHLADFPEKVWNEYDCSERMLPFFRLEKVELVPNRVKAGSDFNHRLVYVLCPDRPTAVIAGSLDTRILFRGQSIVVDQNPAYELKPGRWIVDAFVEIPEHADLGVYSMELDFAADGLSFQKRLSFSVEAAE